MAKITLNREEWTAAAAGMIQARYGRVLVADSDSPEEEDWIVIPSGESIVTNRTTYLRSLDSLATYAVTLNIVGLGGGGGGVESAPVVTAQPYFSPASGRRVGDTVTLNFGSASGSPTPTRTWTLRRGATDVSSQVTNGQITFTQSGTYTLEVSWSNGVGGPVQATSATIVVSPAAETLWQVAGDINELTITTMPTPAPLVLTGGMNEITIGY